MNSSSSNLEKRQSLFLFIGLALLVAMGLAAWAYQLANGMQTTGLDQHVVWGLYIAGFFTAAGAGAGLLVLISINIWKPFLSEKSQYKLLFWALGSFCSAGILIAMDVGYPLNLWHLIAGGRMSSLMTWDFWLFETVFIATVAHLLIINKKKNISYPVALISILAALLLVTVEAMMLSSLVARPHWSEGNLIIKFLLGAGISGIGLALLSCSQAECAVIKSILAALLLTALVVTGLETTQVLSSVQQNNGLFFAHLLGGLLIPLALLFQKTMRVPTIISLLLIVGVLVEKIEILSAGQGSPFTALPAMSYSPSAIETIAVIGATAFGGLVFLGLQKTIGNRIN